MKRITLALAVTGVAAGMASAQQVPPSVVQYDEYGDVSEPLTATAGDPVQGRLVMASRGQGNCIACHAVSDMEEFPFHGEVGPPLDGVGDRWSEASLRGIVANAKNVFPGTIMPAFYKVEGYVRPGDAFTGKAAEGDLDPLLTAQEIEDVVAYLMTLKEG
ncbi:sulfur oxidation c-type cytochrome SoxX [Roseitranquillus sediminis]|uniref:sulfur oxidation c-type cytochrome SoxX n=1 Tax=Roseitranquillus sediminis TaxID=2809051 RepID=UPI001D0C78F4|nr:sulfur oxidation c-type cytochrome SoxX [Roseitranquillus sediminis]MBM9594879.1 sulfur oxidation c-type cytochrome SoxX [Roseitranquillus sediminis]